MSNRFLVVALICLAHSHGYGQSIGNPKGIIYGMSIHSGSHQVAAIEADNKIEIWDYKSMNLTKSWNLSGRANAISLSESWLAVGLKSGKLVSYYGNGFSETAETAVSSVSLTRLFQIDPNRLLIADKSGSIFLAEYNLPAITVRRISSEPGEITDMDFDPTRQAIILAYANGHLTLRSLNNGVELKNQALGKSYIFEIDYSKDKNELYVALSKGRVLKFNITDQGFEPVQEAREMVINGWVTCLDYLDKTFAMGSIRELRVYTESGIYQQNQEAIVNHIGIIAEDWPAIHILIGTQGHGLMILDTKSMKVISR